MQTIGCFVANAGQAAASLRATVTSLTLDSGRSAFATVFLRRLAATQASLIMFIFRYRKQSLMLTVEIPSLFQVSHHYGCEIALVCQ